MRVTEEQLKEQQINLDCVDIRPVGGMYYMARLWSGDQLFLLSDGTGKTRLFTSTYAVRKALKGVTRKSCVLRDHSAYDEMIGLGPAASESLDLPLGEVE